MKDIMEEERNKKRWSVTYTKHVKQKRKVYQDGFLELHASSDSTFKIKLFDDCQKLLECRILKDEEAVSSGETLTFSSYLVDVGDPDGDYEPVVSDPSFLARGRKIVETPPRPPRQKFRSPSISSSEGRKDEPGKKMAWAAQSLSSSHKMIRG
uniref:Uncharacterized protein MANES_01G049500 n=1 Tax=Rhizophora mucronata TaxID=61149 RepID=A0A2P2LLD0_RHIMU